MRERVKLIVICALAYLLMDAPVQMTQILPSYAGIKNFLPSVLGLFFGAWGVIGCVIGCVVSACPVNPDIPAVLHECWCIIATGLVMFIGWHLTAPPSRHGRITLAIFSCWPEGAHSAEKPPYQPPISSRDSQ